MKKYAMYCFACLFLFVGLSYSQNKSRKEVVKKRSLYSKTYYNADSTYTLEVYTSPIHYRKGEKLVDIKEDIVPSNTDYAYEVTQGRYHVYFQNHFNDDYPVLYEKDGVIVGFGLKAMVYWDKKLQTYEIIEKAGGSPYTQIEKNQLVYKNVFPGVDLEYAYLSDQLKEGIRLTSKARSSLPSPTSFNISESNAYLMFLQKVDLGSTLPASIGTEKIGRGSEKRSIETYDPVCFKDKKGETLFHFIADYAFVRIEDEDKLANKKNAVRMLNRLFKDGNDYYMLSGIPYSDLKELPAGDIIFDPTVEDVLDNSDPTNKDTQICSYSSYVAYNYGGREYDIKAFHRSSYEYRTLLEFDCGSGVGVESIQSATLTMYAQSFASVADNVNVYELNTEWVEGTEDGTANQTGATWNTYDGTNNWSQNGGDFNTTIKGTYYVEQVGTCTFSLDATMVTGWLTIPANNHGILLACSRDISGGDECRVGFSTSANADASKRPKLEIVYTADDGGSSSGTGGSTTTLPAGTTFYIRGADGNVVATYKGEETSE